MDAGFVVGRGWDGHQVYAVYTRHDGEHWQPGHCLRRQRRAAETHCRSVGEYAGEIPRECVRR